MDLELVDLIVMDGVQALLKVIYQINMETLMKIGGKLRHPMTFKRQKL